jgi:hypothetical protein
MTYPRTAPLKLGDTFGLTATYKVAGVPTAITEQTFSSQVRTEDGVLVATLQVTVFPDQVANTGKFHLAPASGSTQNWPADADLFCDIQVSDGGVVRSTDTFVIPTVQDITRV